MSDYGYRPDPPPEDGQSYGGASGRAHPSASPGGPYGNAGHDPASNADHGWNGGPSPQYGGTGAQGAAPRPGGSGRASVGGPATGSAGVGRGGRASVGSASVGSASVGSASVGPAPTGTASVGPAPTGTASVGKASVGGASGSASVGSASVGSASVGPRPIDLDDEPSGSAARTGRAGSGGGRGRRRAGKGPSSDDDSDDKKNKKRRRRRKLLAGLIACGVLFVAAITVVAFYFFQDVPAPGDIRRAGESSTFTYADEDNEVAGYGDQLRLQAEAEEIPDTVKHALVALEDRRFYDHGGVDYQGTARALVNNVTGGDTQGASTITQQYAGMVMEIRNEISYDRKAREAVMAMKMESEYSKDDILTAYLNLAYFGRGATGIEAAAKVYFDVSVDELDFDQAAFIVMQVKSPNGFYDPYYEDVYDESATESRWDGAMSALVEEGYLSQAERDEYAVPEPTDEFQSQGSWGGNTDIGFITNEVDGYVYEELEQRYGITPDMLGGRLDQQSTPMEQNGGYKVVLTIDKDVQESLRTTGSRGEVKVEKDEDGNYLNKDGEVVTDISDAERILSDDDYVQFEDDNDDAALKGYDPYMMSAMVAVDSENGGVLGYYGGDNGFGVDKAGPESPHPPSSTMKLVTAATAIENGDSIESWFNAGSPRGFDSLVNEDEETCIGGGEYPDCTLRNGDQSDTESELTLTDAVRNSKNTPMYSISEQYEASAILDYADRMGLNEMSQTRQLTGEDGEQHDVTVNYHFNDDDSYTQHGQAVDAEGNGVTNAAGNWDSEAPIQVDDDCTPIVNSDGKFLLEEGDPKVCTIGDKGATDPFYHHLSFGQYPTSVRDMAAIYATIANDGVYNETHFVAKVYDNQGNEVQPIEDLGTEQAISVETARDLQWVGSEIAGESDSGEDLGRDYFGKTGTWEATCDDCEESWNAHAWYTGAISQMSIAAWVGNVTSESDPISDPNGDKSNVFGSNTAYPVWHAAMERVIDAKGDSEHWESKDWQDPVKAGSINTWDLDKAGFNPDGKYCSENGDDPKCGPEEDEDEGTDEDCEDGEPGDENCEGDDPTEDPSDEPTDDESSDDECDPDDWFCEEEPTTDPGDGDESQPGEEGWDNG